MGTRDLFSSRPLWLVAVVAPLILMRAIPALADVYPPPAGAFTLVVLPDTQHYTDVPNREEIFLSQTRWIAEHRENHNIKYVLHVGDVVEHNTAPQWDLAKQVFQVLDEAEVPYAIAPGNHDYGPNGTGRTRDSGFNEAAYFGPGSAYADQPTVGGFFEEGKTDNSYHVFEAGGRDWIVLALEWRPRIHVIRWARKVMNDHPDHTGILLIHNYLATGIGATRTAAGDDLWNHLVSRHNFAFVFCGHVIGSGQLTSVGRAGQVVHQILADYQGLEQGGNGYLRVVQVLPTDGTVRVRTYSTFLDSFMDSHEEQFDLILCDTPEEATDVNRNSIPDVCEPDCNRNALSDLVDIAEGPSLDSNSNRVPDECDVHATFTVTREEGEVPLEVRVDATGSTAPEDYSIVSYKWDFGDGTTADVPALSHSYNEPGVYTIRLAVRDERSFSATAAHNVSALFPSGDVSPWISHDVGEPAVPGGARRDDECYSIFAGGEAFRAFRGEKVDEFHFLYQEVSGDFVLTARISDLAPESHRAAVGLMVRESLDSSARHASVLLRRLREVGPRFDFLSRLEADGVSTARSGERADVPDAWLRIERRGDEVLGSGSTDGFTWEAFAPVAFDLPEVFFIGVAVSARDQRQSFLAVTATVCSLELVQELQEFRRGDVNADGRLDIGDVIFLFQYLFTGQSAPTCEKAADCDDKGQVDVSDASYLLSYLLFGGAAPAEPLQNCGLDVTPDELGCDEHRSCR